MSVEVEKGTVLAIAIFLISSGSAALAQGGIIEGSLLIAWGVVLLFVREHLKLHRWAHVKTFWRGESV